MDLDGEDGTGTGAVEETEALARLCGGLAAVRALAEARGEGPALDRVLAGLREGGGTAALLAEADELLRRCGVARGLGLGRARVRPLPVPPGTQPPAGGTGLPPAVPGLGGGHAVEEAYVCPAGRCARVVLADDVHGGARDGGGPECAVLARPLRLVRL